MRLETKKHVNLKVMLQADDHNAQTSLLTQKKFLIVCDIIVLDVTDKFQVGFSVQNWHCLHLLHLLSSLGNGLLQIQVASRNLNSG